MALKSPAQSERRLLASGATLTVFGIAASTGELGSLAGVLTLGGLIAIIVGLHRFGRTGPDGAARRTDAAQPGTPKPKRTKRARSPRPRP
ncbi:MAG TPA: hypothetical protein VI197_26705 [Polyangiaceae bacterium]